MPRPKLTAAVLVGGTALLVGATVVAVELPAHGAFWRPASMQALLHHPSASSRPTSNAKPNPVAAKPSVAPPVVPAAKPTRSTPTQMTSHTVARVPTPPRTPSSVTYTVKRGDTLSGIAQWFDLHGYATLYAANANVIGRDPNLIRPGERITLGAGSMTLRPPA